MFGGGGGGGGEELVVMCLDNSARRAGAEDVSLAGYVRMWGVVVRGLSQARVRRGWRRWAVVSVGEMEVPVRVEVEMRRRVILVDCIVITAIRRRSKNERIAMHKGVHCSAATEAFHKEKLKSISLVPFGDPERPAVARPWDLAGSRAIVALPKLQLPTAN